MINVLSFSSILKETSDVSLTLKEAKKLFSIDVVKKMIQKSNKKNQENNYDDQENGNEVNNDGLKNDLENVEVKNDNLKVFSFIESDFGLQDVKIDDLQLGEYGFDCKGRSKYFLKSCLI